MAGEDAGRLKKKTKKTVPIGTTKITKEFKRIL
jgi:hypothetical protein